ncbi:MAG: hypothetical protein ASARMPRED_007364 [Alectoria sarmentosa]|nr:MAG: hypothetical protein ASARMPRED_007364 [Alectoria sarmentosa]
MDPIFCYLKEIKVKGSIQLSKELTNHIIAYSIDRAHQLWGDGVFSAWAKEWSKEHGVKIDFVQPDTADRSLLTFGIRGCQLIIAGNEWADIMHVVLLNISGLGTVHGSADDIAVKGLVNPAATIRAAASILEHQAGCKGIQLAIEFALLSLRRRPKVTLDQGGNSSNTEVIDSIFDTVTAAPRPPRKIEISQSLCAGKASAEERGSLGKETLSNSNGFSKRFRVSWKAVAPPTERTRAPSQPEVVSNTSRVIDFARPKGLEIIFVRFLGDPRYQVPNMLHRDVTLGKHLRCLEGTWEVNFQASAQPAAGERIFIEQPCFDALLAEGTERYLVNCGCEYLVFMGIYCDVGVDVTARTGFQKGFYFTLVEHCTAALHLRAGKSLAWSSRYFSRG